METLSTKTADQTKELIAGVLTFEIDDLRGKQPLGVHSPLT
jgi:hypothetical protein